MYIRSLDQTDMSMFHNPSLKTILLFIALNYFIGSSCQSPSQEITVMSYNVYHGENPYQTGTSNLVEIADIIKQQNPDFVALQEVDSMTNRTAGFNNGKRINVAEELGVLTDMRGLFGKAIDYSNGGYGEGLLVPKSDAVLSHQRHMLPIPKGGEDRAVLLVHNQFPNGREFIFAGTHLCHQFAENRVAQAQEIVRYFRQKDKPVILCGDFNFQPDSEPYNIMMEFFDDAAILFGNPQNTYSAKNPDKRIDYVFLSKSHRWKVADLKVLNEEASDHMPVVAKIDFKN